MEGRHYVNAAAPEGSTTEERRENQHPRRDTFRGSSFYMLLGVSFGLLCVIQVALNVSFRLQAVSTGNSTGMSAGNITLLVEERDHLVKERDHLVEERDHLLEERDHLVEERDHLVKERAHLVKERAHLVEERNQSIRSINKSRHVVKFRKPYVPPRIQNMNHIHFRTYRRRSHGRKRTRTPDFRGVADRPIEGSLPARSGPRFRFKVK